MLKRIIVVSALLSAPGIAQMARAGTLDEGQWVTTVTGGTSLPTHDTLQSFAMGSGIDAGRFDSTLAGVPTTATLDHLRFTDAFDAGTGFGIETGYMIRQDLEPFARLARTQLDGRNIRIGTVDLTSATPITADFDDLKSWTLDAGLRYFVVDTGRVRAFVDGYLGANRADAVNARVSVGGASPTGVDERYLPQRTKFDTGVDGGVSLQVSDTTDLSLSVGAQYVAGREMSSPLVDSLGVDGSVHDEHWSVPMNLGLTVHF